VPPVRLLEGTRPLYPRIHPLIPPASPRATAPRGYRRGVSQGLVSFQTVFARIRRLGLSAVSVRKDEAALVVRSVRILRVGSKPAYPFFSQCYARHVGFEILMPPSATGPKQSPPLIQNGCHAVRLACRRRWAAFDMLQLRLFEVHQSITSNPLIISIATAVPPCTPNATVLFPPCRNTITASAIGIMVAISMNQPRACADPKAISMAASNPDAMSRIPLAKRYARDCGSAPAGTP